MFFRMGPKLPNGSFSRGSETKSFLPRNLKIEHEPLALNSFFIDIWRFHDIIFFTYLFPSDLRR